jgi:hypothetical protein
MDEISQLLTKYPDIFRLDFNSDVWATCPHCQTFFKLIDDNYVCQKCAKPLYEQMSYYNKIAQYGFCCIADPFDQKENYDKGWQKNGIRDPLQWESWVKAKTGNLAVLTGKISNLTMIDIDTFDLPECFQKIIHDTFSEKSRSGWHIGFAYESDLPSTQQKENKFEIKNDKLKVTIYPSIVGGKQRILVCDKQPMKMPDDVKEYLISHFDKSQNQKMAKKKEPTKLPTFDNDPVCGLRVLKDGDGRNNTLIKILGVFRRRFGASDCKYIANVIQENFFKEPLPYGEFMSLLDSLDQYVQLDNSEIKERIMEYMQKVKTASKRDVLMMLCADHKDMFKESERLDLIISDLVDADQLLRRGDKLEFYNAPLISTKWDEDVADYGLKLKFMPASTFCNRSTIIIGGKTGTGKTTLAMGLIKEIIGQGFPVTYFSTETDSKFTKTARAIGLKEGDFLFGRVQKVEHIKFTKNAINIVDWISAPADNGYAGIEKLFEEIKEKQKLANAFLIVFVQLKEDGSFFAQNMIKNYASDVYKFLYNKDDDRFNSYFEPIKIRDAKENVGNPFAKISTVYNSRTKQLDVLSDYIKTTEDKGELVEFKL